jgi:HAD superfamily hydrolase (TIGR01484 family)
MQELCRCPRNDLANLRGVLADIDDTITTEGRLTALAYGAMEKVHDAGLLMIPVTGRPAGWCDHIARMWPVHAVVGENGAFWFRYHASAQRIERYFCADSHERRENRKRLRTIADEIFREIPDARTAADQLYREADLAIDYCEDVPRLADAKVDRIANIMRANGLTAKISSIHVNGWFGDHDKLSTTLKLLAQCFAVDADSAKSTFAFIGDSPNDQPMFEYFTFSFGVANVRAFESRMTVLPRYVTKAPGGSGFAEFAERLLGAKRKS